MRVSWVFEGKGGDHVEVTDAEAACTALSGAVRDAYGEVGPEGLTGLLSAVYALRLPMVTEGTAAVERGDEWSATVGTILVTLLP
jgi:hypothetical protein